MNIYENMTFKKLFKIALPSIFMMILMSLYTIVDGIFISRYIGSDALSSLNIVYPVINIVIAIGMMLATGGNAIISKKLGEENEEQARSALSMFVFVGFILGIILIVLVESQLTKLSLLLGASKKLLENCNRYLSMMMFFAPATILQTLFQSYFVTANRPSLGLALSVISGIVNVFLDAFFILKLNLGISGAALATGIGQMIPAIVGLYFFFFNQDELYFVKFKMNFGLLKEACYNGMSEMVSQLSGAVMTFLFNIVLMYFIGEKGVAAITILLYVEFLFNAFYLGFSIGISPIVGYKFGAKQKDELKLIYKTSFIFVIISSLVLTIISLLSMKVLVGIFTQDQETYLITISAFKIFAFNFLFSGFNITSSGFFTALSNGKVSAIISFCRMFLFTCGAIIILSMIFKVTGTWLAVPVAEFLTCIVSLKYHQHYFLRNSAEYL